MLQLTAPQTESMLLDASITAFLWVDDLFNERGGYVQIHKAQLMQQVRSERETGWKLHYDGKMNPGERSIYLHPKDF